MVIFPLAPDYLSANISESVRDRGLVPKDHQ